MSKFDFSKFIQFLDVNEGISKSSLAQIEKKIDIEFPEDYKSFMIMYNGCEGPIGENAYIQLWPVEELFKKNKEYSIDKNFPDFLVFGTDGGGTAYAFDRRFDDMPIIYFEFTVIDMEDVFPCADSFFKFLEYLYNL